MDPEHDRAELVDEFRQLLSRVNDREALVLAVRLGLDLDPPAPRTLGATAAYINVSQVRVTQILTLGINAINAAAPGELPFLLSRLMGHATVEQAQAFLDDSLRPPDGADD